MPIRVALFHSVSYLLYKDALKCNQHALGLQWNPNRHGLYTHSLLMGEDRAYCIQKSGLLHRVA